MSFENDWAATADLIHEEAGSLANVFGRLRSALPRSLIDDDCWQRILGESRNLPAAAAASPFGFELPLHIPDAHADFGVTCIVGSLTARVLGEGDPVPEEICRLLGRLQRMIEDPTSRARTVVGPITMLEYDVWSSPDGQVRVPGVFLYPVNQAILASEGKVGSDKASTLVNSIAELAELDEPTSYGEQAAHVFNLLPPHADLRGVGAFLGRRSELIRITPMGLADADELDQFLSALGHDTANRELATSFAARLAGDDSYDYLGVALDLGRDSVRNKLGVAFHPKRKDYLKPRPLWTPFIERLRACGICDTNKLDALKVLPSGPQTYVGRNGRYVLVRGTQHIKLVFKDGQLDSVKAYLFNVICALPGR